MYELRSSEFFNDASASGPPGAEVRSVELQPGLAVSLVSFRMGQGIRATAVNDRAEIHFSCLFQGEVGVEFGRGGFTLPACDLLTSFAPGEHFSLDLPADYRSVELTVGPEALAALAGGDFDRLGEDIRGGFCVHRHGRHRRAGDAAARLGRLLEEDGAAPLLVHSAALEFLAWHLKSYRSAEDGASLPTRERKQLLAARERLLQDLSAPPTIAELARETGLNQLKLKRGFKVLFGTSIYALFQRERMDQARHLLQRHGVTGTAMMLGYSNVSHFSAAFRRQFGVLPREARRGLLE